MGRAYFGDFKGLRELATVLFIGGLIYIPLCLYEIRMSPQLHNTIYGFYQHDFVQTMRAGGWRPTVFLQHGLAVGLFMSVTSLIGAWLWYSMPSRTFPRQTIWLAGRSVTHNECAGQILGRIGTSCTWVARTVLVHDASHTHIGSAFALIFPAVHCGEGGRRVVWRPAARSRAVE